MLIITQWSADEKECETNNHDSFPKKNYRGRGKQREREKESFAQNWTKRREVTGGGLSISSLSSCAIDSSAISHGPLQEGKKARVNATMARRQLVGKNFTPRSPLYHLVRQISFSLSLSLDTSFLFPSYIRPPAVLPLQYLRACRSTSDFHLSRFTSSTIRDISVHVFCFALEYRRVAARCNALQPERQSHFCINLLRVTIDLCNCDEHMSLKTSS